MSGKRVAIYLRVSSADQAEGYSLDGQRKACRDYCDQRGYRVVRIHQDTGSGKNDDRPAFQYLMRLAAAGSFDLLVVWRRDRYFRNAVEAGFWENRLKNWGVRVESVQQGPQEDNRHTRFINGIVDLFAEMERGDIADRLSLGRHTAARAGVWPTRPPFGYTKLEGHLVPEPAQADLMRQAYRECIRGANSERLGILLGITATQAIRRIRNPLYKGQHSYGGTQFPVPPLVSEETWMAAQDAIASRYLNKGKPGGIPYSRRFPS